MLSEEVPRPNNSSRPSKRAFLDASRSFAEPSYDKPRESNVSSFLKGENHSMSMSIADLSSLSLMVEKDPELCGSGELFSAFKDVLCFYPYAGQVFDMIDAYEKLCRDQIKNLLDFVNQVDPSRKRFQNTAKLIKFLYQECYTWRLMGSLVKDRLVTESAEVQMTDDEYTVRDEFSSKKQTIEKLFAREPSVKYSQLVVDWLEKNAEDKINDLILTDNIQFSSDSISWEHTLHDLTRFEDSKLIRIVTELDPDAPIRQKRSLADLDEADEVRLLQFIFSFLRAGRLDEAKKICVKYGQSWRAATLDGWRLWHDPNFQSAHESNSLEQTEGNPFGRVWKQCCWQMCEDEGISLQEKAIYAALSGNLRQLLNVCETWEDSLWAYFKVLVDTKVEEELTIDCNLELDDNMNQHHETQDLNAENIFEQLDSHVNSSIRYEGKQAFHLVQKYLILDQPKRLLEVIEENLDNEEGVSAHMLRFMTHAVIFFQTVGLDVDDALFTKLVKSYIKVLVSKNHGEQIATYAARLPPEEQIEVYAKFLEQIEKLEDREHFLDLAKDTGLDVMAISKAVVRNICESNPVELQGEEHQTEGDKKKIEAINLLILEPSQRIDALMQANAISLGFLASKKLDAAKETFNKLPDDSIDVIHIEWEKEAGATGLPAAYENAIKEHLCIKSYLSAHDAFNSWFEHFSHKAPVKPQMQSIRNFKEQITFEELMNEYKGQYAMWKRNLDIHVENVSDKIYNVLLFPEGWLTDFHESADEDVPRLHQMKLLRQIAIPMLCFMLHSALQSSERYKECLHLADVVQSEQHKLYAVFKKEDLQKLIGLFRESSLAVLSQSENIVGF